MSIKIARQVTDIKEGKRLMALCPFQAISFTDGQLSINSGCKMCRFCVKNGGGVFLWEEESRPEIRKEEWRGIAVFAEKRDGSVHPVTLELLGKAEELASRIGHPVYVVVIGSQMEEIAEELLYYGADKVFLYDDPQLAEFMISPYANAFYDFIQRVQPSSVLVGATSIGRSLAPKVAARAKTGLTADCTILDVKENTDLIQIRPAFGGNIMAQIVTPNHRPQFCTVRYKIFSAPQRQEKAKGVVVRMEVSQEILRGDTQILSVEKKPKEMDIAEADVIVAFGRGVKSQEDLGMIYELAELLKAQVAATRPMIEENWIDSRRQIGLSGRTVKPSLLITVGVSGSVQFAAGMKNSDFIIAINQDENAPIFDIAHVGLVGDLYEILPDLIAGIKEDRYQDWAFLSETN